MSGIVRAVHQSSSKLGDTPLVRLDLFESLPSRRFGCRASTTNSTAKSRSTSLYNARSSSRSRCRALQLYSAPERSTSLQLYSALHSTSSTPSLSLPSGVPQQRAPRSCTVFVMTPPNEHSSEGGRDDRGVPYHAESTLSSAQVLKQHTFLPVKSLCGGGVPPFSHPSFGFDVCFLSFSCAGVCASPRQSAALVVPVCCERGLYFKMLS